MIKAVIFDLDDTLISEKEYVISGYKHISNILSNELSISKQVIFNDLLILFNQSPKKVFNRLLDKYKVNYDDNYIMNLVNEYRNHYPQIHFYDDVLPCVTALKNKGLKLGIITDGYAVTQRNKIEAIRAKKYFDEIIITDELGRKFWKPHPKSFILMKYKLSVDFEQMVYIGDNLMKDFTAPQQLGIKTVYIKRTGDRIYKNLNEDNYYVPDICIENLDQLYKYIVVNCKMNLD